MVEWTQAWDSVSVFVIHVGEVAVAIPIGWYLPIFILATYTLLLMCLVPSLYNMNFADLTLKQATVVTLLIFVGLNLPWFLWYGIQLS